MILNISDLTPTDKLLQFLQIFKTTERTTIFVYVGKICFIYYFTIKKIIDIFFSRLKKKLKFDFKISF